MATTFVATKGHADYPVAAPTSGKQPVTVYSSYDITAALVINDVIQMIRVPEGATIISVTLGSDDLDTNGAPAITLDVGDGGDVDRYIAASTIAQAGTIPVEGILKTGFGYTYTTEDTIDVMVKAAPATGAATGTIRLSATYMGAEA